MDSYHIAVFDIGKTNKKLVIFDAGLNICEIEKTNIEEYEKDGIKYDDLGKIDDWLITTLREKASLYDIRIISVSAHGATFTCVDENGELAIPCISYTTDPGDNFHDEFFNEFGPREKLQQTLATPDFNLLLNVSKGIWFAKKTFQESFKKVRHILNLSQYFTFKLTGIVTADPTYTGCHSYLWDFEKKDWSSVTEKMGIRQHLPDTLVEPWKIAGNIREEIAAKTGLSKETLVTTGVHDSNASLLPHLINSKNSFILNSTGTWCVLMHQQEKVEFKKDELGKVVFFNLSPFFKPVKTTIFMGGVEFEAYDEILKNMHNGRRYDSFNAEIYTKILIEKRLFILPGITRGTGQFPDSHPRVIEDGKIFNFEEIKSGAKVPSFFNDPETAYAVLNLSLAIQTKVSLQRTDMKNGMDVFVEGGFSQNESYNNLISAFYPDSSFYLTSLKEATAFGAAILGKAALEGKKPGDFKELMKIDKIQIRKYKLPDLNEYSEKFLSLI